MANPKNNFQKIPLHWTVQTILKKLGHVCEIAKVFDSKIILIYVAEKSISVNLLDRNEYLKILHIFGSETLDKSKKSLSKQWVGWRDTSQRRKHCK